MLALELGGAFIDLDERIESLFGESIPTLFSVSEAHFRRCERRALLSLIAEPGFSQRPSVVATGGGVVIDADNRAAMLAAGTVAFIDVSLDELVRRLQTEEERSGRPLVAEAGTGLRGRVAQMLAGRRHAYLDGSVVIDGDSDPDDVVGRLLDVLDPDGQRGSRVG
jgi:shikimate kinase